MDELEANALAKRLGLEPPERVGTPVPGVAGVDDLRRQVEERLQSSGGRPTDLSWTTPRRIPFNDQTWLGLQGLAQRLSTKNRRVAAGQVAALIIEDRLRSMSVQSYGESINLDNLPLPEVGLRAPASYEQAVESLSRQLESLRALRQREQTFALTLQTLRQLIGQAQELDPVPDELMVRLYLEYSTSARHLGKTSFVVAEETVALAKQIAVDCELSFWIHKCDYEQLRLLMLKDPTTNVTLRDRRQATASIRRGLACLPDTDIDIAWIFHTEGEMHRQAAVATDIPAEAEKNFTIAQLRYQKALIRFADSGDDYGTANANERLAVCAIHLDNPKRAKYHADAAIETARRLNLGRTKMRARVARLHAEWLVESQKPTLQLENLIAELDAAGYEQALERLVEVQQA
jgi:hypothetical protein